MDDWPTDAWVSQTAPLVVAPTDRRGVYQVSVIGAGGERRYHRVVDAGRVTGGGATAADEPDVAFTLTRPDAEAMADGRLDPAVAFMQGRMKTSGDPGWVIDLLAGWSSPAGRQAAQAMAELAGRHPSP
jgi:hypothetical protein